ncbi:hypothetical protein PLESTB_001535900 [Pleodorina starrii]|uniref:Uncharacterized protein n=1 Tax=Pleodorina starrii TaxID=330485 RepID=A0A9W6F828_9CHLO|nr:hypothetical protein PLESTM_001841100 [Pleodorina starrii]GLC59789.1 hypothetical protein PLESTB_001535900 [Pleodorina starrii]GLC67328.1 hypothetical protein PLESTF_000542900 [Pleodorina starrii]
MGVCVSTHGALAPRRRDAEVSDTVLKALHAGIQSRGLEAAALAPPFMQSGDAFKSLDDLPNCLFELHYSMPPTIMEAPMRLIKIGALRKWSRLKVYEEIEPETECLQLPYTNIDDDKWKRVATVSWRWASQRPEARLQDFSPMSERQFQELVELLRIAADAGIEFVWIDWSCVPQYSEDSMVEVHRSKVFYARARLMLVLPAFHSLPDGGPVRVILAKALRELKARAAAANSIRCTVAASIIDAILAKNIVAGREYFGRVWTLAERMARFGHSEGLCHWLSLESWLGMVVHAMLQSTEDKASSIIYKKMLGEEVAALLDSVLEPLAAAVRIGGVQAQACDGLEVKVADLCLAAVGVWLSPTRLLNEEPTRKWLHVYLGEEARSGIYHAWSEADRIWAIYSYFCFNQIPDQQSAEGLHTALEALVEIASGDHSSYLNGMYAQLGIECTRTSRVPADDSGLGQQEEGQRSLVEERAPQAAAGSVEATGVQAEEVDKEGPASCDDSNGRLWDIQDREQAAKAWRVLRSMAGKGGGGQQPPGGEPSSSASTRTADRDDDTDDGSISSDELPDFRDFESDHRHLKWLISQLSSPDPRVLAAAVGLMRWLAGDCSWHITHVGGVPPLVSLLSRADTAVQRTAAAAFAEILDNNPSGCYEFVTEVYAIPSLLRLLDSSEPHLQAAAATILYHLACNEWCGVSGVSAEFELVKAIPRLVELLSSSDTEVQKGAAWALRAFAWKGNTAHKLSITGAGAIPPLVKLLDSPEEDVASAAARVLQELAEGGETYQVAIVDAGVVPCLVALIGRPADDQGDVRNNALRCLAALAVHPSCQAAIIEADGIPPLLEYLKYDNKARWVNSSSKAAGVLRDLSADSACQQQIARHGIPRLVRTLGNPDDVEQQRWAASRLKILAGIAANRVSIAEAGGIWNLVELLGSSDDDVQESAVEALGTLALDADNRVAIAEAGAIPCLAHLLLRKCIDDGDIYDSVPRALGNLACHASNQVAIAGQIGVIPKLVEMLKDRSCFDRQRGAAWALRNLALNAANQVSIAETGGIPPLVEILMSDSSDDDVLREAAAALGNLAVNAANQEAIAKADGIPPLIKLLSHENTGMQQQAAAALGNLAVNAANQEAIAKAGGIPPLVKLLSHKDTGVQQQAAAALGNLALNSANQVSIAQAGGIGVLMELVSSSADADVKAAAAGALGSLALNAKNKVTIELLKPHN